MKSFFSLCFMALLALPLSAQEDTFPLNRLGLTVEYGMGGCAIVDDYLSHERYTGTLPYIGVWYNRLHDGRGFRLGITHQEDDDLENYAIRASFMRTAVNFDQIFMMKDFTLFGSPAAWYFGPSVEYFEYELINRFSSSHKVMSELIMVSMGINTSLDVELTRRLTVGFFLRGNVLGVNYKTHDELKYADKNSKLQTLISANNLNADLQARYRILKRVSLGLTGKAQYTRSSGWDRSVSFVNSIIAFAIIHF